VQKLIEKSVCDDCPAAETIINNLEVSSEGAGTFGYDELDSMRVLGQVQAERLGHYMTLNTIAQVVSCPSRVRDEVSVPDPFPVEGSKEQDEYRQLCYAERIHDELNGVQTAVSPENHELVRDYLINTAAMRVDEQ